MSQGSEPPPASESYTGMGTGEYKVVKAFGEYRVNRTGISRGESGDGKGEHLHGVWGRCHQGPERLLLFSQPLIEETKMNAEVSSLKVPV